jgi:hypothetical protein
MALRARRVNFPLPKSSLGGRIGFELSRLVEAVNSLRPISTDDEFVSVTTLGTKRVKVKRKPSSSLFQVERLLIVTEATEYLFCQRMTDAEMTFYVAKPEGFYTADSDGKIATAYPDILGTEDVTISAQLIDTRTVNFPVDPIPITKNQRITPAYREGYSVIYAMPLAETLSFPGDVTCTHIDMNIGDVRRWETLAPLDGSHEAPVTFV